ncbi:MAG: YkgJ family cysteine cluster protein [Lachnospiraceae bacterium]|nr:YkgJ family cysteine cluster protein [Lachnospiraceae bacterium]
MRLDTRITEISDGKLYDAADMVRIGCHDCEGCSECCKGMGDTILLDPYDIHRMTKGLNKKFEQLLLEQKVDMHVEDGLILPHLRMNAEGACRFLNDAGRCSIHANRPGICRLFPLGRQYDEDKVSYFVLKDGCPATNRTKMKLEKWLDTPNLKEYENYLVAWHNLTKKLRAELAENQDETYQKQVSTLFLQLFFIRPYGEDFFTDFYERKNLLG